MVITEHITGQVVDRPPGSTAQEVVDGLVVEFGLPRRTENGELVNYRLVAHGAQLVATDAVTSDAELESEVGEAVYRRVNETLDEIESALSEGEPALHLSTRLAVARRTGAVPQRVEAVESAFRERAFQKPEVAATSSGFRAHLLPIAGIVALVAVFGWLFWYTEPNTPDLVVAQESDEERTMLDGPAEIEGRIDRNQEVDLYAFEAVEGDFVTVAMIATGNVNVDHFDAELSVNGPDGTQIAYNDDFNGLNSQVSFDVVEPGEHVIRARALSGCCVGDYVLIFEISR